MKDVLFDPHSIDMLYPNSFLIGFMHLPDGRYCSIDVCACRYNLEQAKVTADCATGWAVQAGDFVFLKDGTVIDMFEADDLGIDYSFETPEAAYGWYIGLRATGQLKTEIKNRS